MISTSLFFKRIKNEAKRSLWAYALGILVYFFALPVACAVVLSRVDGVFYMKEDGLSELIDYLGAGNAIIAICTFFSAVICALSQFHYLQSRKQSDFYESMPMTRKQLLMTKALNGLCIFIVSYWSNMVLTSLILSAKGYLSSEVIKTVFISGFYHLIGFLLLYLTTIMAVLLSGTFIVSLLVTTFLFFTGPAVYILYRSLMAYFFQTYYNSGEINWNILSGTSFLTPYINLLHTAEEGGSVLKIICGILITIVLLACAVLFIYRNRPAEGAQKAILFSPAFTVIKFIIVFICSYGFALLMETITDEKRTGGWFLFGLAMGMLLSSTLSEMIQNADFRCAFSHKRHLLILAGVLVVSYLMLRFDLFGYDRYLPNEDQIESVAVDFKELDTWKDGVDFTDISLEYMNYHKYRLTYMKLTKFEDVLAIAKKGIQTVKETSFVDYSSYGKNVVIKYRLKNGKEICRQYNIEDLYSTEEFEHVYDMPEYKKGVVPLLSIPAETVTHMYCEMDNITVPIGNSSQEIANLVRTFQEEFLNLTAEEVREEAPLARLTFLFPEGMRYSAELYVYPSFTKTIELIRAYGFPLSDTMNVNKIKQITVYGVMDQGLLDGDTYIYGGNDQVIKETAESQPYGSVTITDSKMIARLFPYLESDSMIQENSVLHPVNQQYWAEVSFYDGEYNQITNQGFSFSNEELPEDIVSFLQESIHFTWE